MKDLQVGDLARVTKSRIFKDRGDLVLVLEVLSMSYVVLHQKTGQIRSYNRIYLGKIS